MEFTDPLGLGRGLYVYFVSFRECREAVFTSGCPIILDINVIFTFQYPASIFIYALEAKIMLGMVLKWLSIATYTKGTLPT